MSPQKKIKIVNEKMAKVLNGANDVLIEFSATVPPDSPEPVYHMVSRMLDMSRTATSKAEIFAEARAALRRISEALDEMEHGG